MIKKRNFDKKFLIQTRNNLKQVLQNNNLSIEEQNDIKDTIFFLENAIKKTYWKNQKEDIPDFSLETLKNKVLEKMKKDYILLGSHFINWVLEDCENIFKLPTPKEINMQKTTDEMIELSLNLYKQYSNTFYQKAKFIYEYPTSLIQEVNHKKDSSFCVYSNYLKLPFFVIARNEGAHIFIHETQHGIESLLNFSTHQYYQELGPTLFETLLLDKLYQEDNNIAYYYKDRMEETVFHTDMFYEYFNILLEFAKKDFCVSNKEFISIFLEKYYLKQDFYVKEFVDGIQEDILSPDNDLYLRYFLSFLKSIELREKLYNNKKEGMKSLYTCLLQRNIQFNFNQENIDCYKRFCEEIKEKQKILTKK